MMTMGATFASSSLICTVNSGLPQLVPVHDILMLVLAEVVYPEVGLSSTVMNAEVNQSILFLQVLAMAAKQPSEPCACLGHAGEAAKAPV